MKIVRRLVIMTLLVAVIAGPNAQSVASEPTTPSVRLVNSVLPPIDTGLAQPVLSSADAASQPLTLTAVLNRGDQAGFDGYLADVQNPRSPNFRHFLGQAALAQRFGPSQQAYDAVLGFFTSNGFRLVQGSANRLTISVTGSRQQAERAFKINIGDYQIAGRSFFANGQAPALPATIAGNVQAISGLSNLARPGRAPIMTKDQVQNECGQLSGLSTVLGISGSFATLIGALAGLSLGPVGIALDLTAATSAVYCYGLWGGYYSSQAGGYFGTLSTTSLKPASGQTTPSAPRSARVVSATTAASQKIGLLEFDSFHASDALDWLSLLGADPAIASRLSVMSVNGGVASPGPNEAEVPVDVDTVMGFDTHADTSYVVYVAPIGTTFQQMFNAMMNDGDTVISNSWSQCEDQTTLADAQSIDSVLAQAAAAGISVFNGSGDTGSTCLNGSPNTVGVPADSPHATAVGGTSPTFGPGFTYGGESWWGGSAQNPPTGQGGFGVSQYFPRPTYQNGLVTSNMRSVPDLAINADPMVGIGICQADAGGCPTGLSYGGTSMAAPEMAALAADLNRSLGSNVGEANIAFYPLSETDSFHSAASMGSDFAHVGLGSPNFNFIQLALSGQTVGDVSPSASQSYTSSPLPADGATPATIRVDLLDANHYPVAGKTVSVTANPGSNAIVSAASGLSSVDGGAVTFSVTDTVAEPVTFTVTDTTDGIILTNSPTVQFVPPPATQGSIEADPASIPADGVTEVTLRVTLKDAAGQGAQGKIVSLSQGSGHAVLTGSGVTDANGVAAFQGTDLTVETVAFTAIDVTDGNLPVPGSAQVIFTNGSGGNACPATTPIAAAGYDLSTFASGFYDGNLAHLAVCGGPAGATFDATGNLYVGNIITGDIFKFGPAGGVATGATKITSTGLGSWVTGVVFGKNGYLYVLQTFTSGGSGQGKIYQIDPSNDSIVRTVADNVLGPTSIAVDPISGDLFVGNGFNGGPLTPAIVRIHDPGPGNPTVDCTNFQTNTTGCTVFAVPGEVDSLSFDPSGTLYVRGAGTTGYNPYIWSITGTSSPNPGTVTLLDSSIPGGGGIAVMQPEQNGKKAIVVVNNNAPEIDVVDLNQSPVQPVAIVLASGFGGIFGPDGCLYAAQSNSILKITSAGGACPFAPATILPTLTLSEDRSSAATGNAVTLTATLRSVSQPQGTNLRFLVTGANPQVKLVAADVNGAATFTYTGVFTGTDQIIASTTVLTSTLTSLPLAMNWTSGVHVSFASFNLSPKAGRARSPVTLKVSLTDISAAPPAPLGNASITIGLGSQSCVAITDPTGTGSCAITPNLLPGTYPMTASFAGSAVNGPATAADSFTVISGENFTIDLPEIPN